MIDIDKKSLIEKIISHIEEEVKRLSGSYNSTKELSTEAPNRMQSRYDTTGIEAAWLADGIAKKIEERKRELFVLNSIKDRIEDTEFVSVFSILSVLEEGKDNEVTYFLVPAGGGIKISLDNKTVISINKDAPFAKEILGKKVGDIFQFRNVSYRITMIK